MLDLLHEQQCRVGIPKYTTLRELTSFLGVKEQIDDQAVLTSLCGTGRVHEPIDTAPGTSPTRFRYLVSTQ